MKTIVGAGLSGLIAAHAWPEALVFEAQQRPDDLQQHKALLRFRGEQVSALTGVPFKPVLVRKNIFSEGRFRDSATIHTANLYSTKVLGRLHNDRSVWDLEPVQRYIAPEDFYQQLLTHVGSRVRWGVKMDFETFLEGEIQPVLNTAPLDVVLRGLKLEIPCLSNAFQRSPIEVHRYRVPGANVYQTVYFPDMEIPLYRASITGDLLIAECINPPEEDKTVAAYTALEDFLAYVFATPDLIKIERANQNYGKIANIPAMQRRAVLATLTRDYGIYSLGRFATWRNILLDDLPQDITIIKHLMAGDDYARRLATTPRQETSNASQTH